MVRLWAMRLLWGMILAGALVAQEQQNLSGVWQLDKEKSTVEVEMAWARVDLTGPLFSVELRVFDGDGAEEGFDWRFAMGGEESSNAMHGAPMKSRAGWDGGTLTVRSVTTFGPDVLKTLDRWSLSNDGNSLILNVRNQYANEPERTSVFVFERRAASAWPPSGASKRAEEAYKNIRILKGTPAGQLTAVMALFTRSLGVDCAHCHIDGDFASDGKAAKQTARRMYEMVNALNRDSFGGTSAVACWTCHRGSAKPESMPATR